MAADPERRIVDLPWMTESEQEQLIGRSTRSQVESDLDEPGSRSAHRGRTRRPDRSPPLRHEGRSMSHVEESVELTLEQKRELVARLLREKAGLNRDEPGLVHRLIEVQAARTPNAVAVTCSGGSLTYFELNARANRAGPTPPRPGRRPRGPGGPVHWPVDGDGGWAPGRSQGGRRLCAARPGLSPRAARLHARRRAGLGPPDRATAA